MDLSDDDRIYSLFEKIRPVVTFNLAGYGVDKTERDPETAYQINSELVSKICMAHYRIRDLNWKGQDVVHTGSALEYGNIGGDLNEASNTVPTIYGRSKFSGTRNLENFCTQYRLKGITARLFTVYGPGEHQGRLLPSLLETARTGECLKLTAGLHKRDFVYVEDIAEGLLGIALTRARLRTFF